MLVASSSPWTPVPLCARRLPVVHSSHRLVMLSFFFIVRWIFVIVSKIVAGPPRNMPKGYLQLESKYAPIGVVFLG